MADIKLVGSNIIKILAQRSPLFEGKVSITTNIKIISIEKFKDKKDTLRVSYIYEVNYGDLGKIELEGNIFILSDQKTLKSLQKSQQEKNFNTPEHFFIMNTILQKSLIKSFEIEEELGLPIHIKLPSLNMKSENK